MFCSQSCWISNEISVNCQLFIEAFIVRRWKLILAKRTTTIRVQSWLLSWYGSIVLYFWINNEVPAHQKLNRTFPRIFLTPFWMEVISTGAFIIFYYVYSSVTTMRCQISGNENHSSMRKNNAGAELWRKKDSPPGPFFHIIEN